jgi:hypothetical protein
MGLVHRGVADDVVDIAGRHLCQLAERHLFCVRYLGQPFRQFVVEAHLLLVDELEQQCGNIGDRDGAVAEVHGGRRGYSGHRLADGLGDDLLAVDGHPHDDRLQVRLRHDVADDAHHRVGPGGVGAGGVGAGTGRQGRLSRKRAGRAAGEHGKGAHHRENAPSGGHAQI